MDDDTSVLRVLVVEDSEADFALALRALQRDGLRPDALRVQTAEALGDALTDREWDAVISDFNLPALDGFQALAMVRAHDPDLPFILVSGTLGEHMAVEALKRGANDYVMKDNPLRLPPALRRSLREAEVRREQRRAEQALLASEAKYRDLIENSADGFFVCTPEGRYLIVNDRFCEFVGYGREELLKVNARQALGGDAGPDIRHRLAALQRGARFQYEREIFRRDGCIVPVEVNLRMLADGNVEGTVRDISERKRAEAAVIEERNLLRGLMDNTPDFIFFKDAELRYLRVNAALAREYEQLGFGDVTGRRASEILAAEVVKGTERLEQGVLAGGPPVIDQVDRQVSGGKSYWRARTEVAIRDETGRITGLVGVARDVTEREQMQANLRRLNRVYAVLSGINGLIVRVRDRDMLFREACRVAFEAGGFSAAWIGVADWSAGRIVPAAHAGRADRHLALIADRLRLDAAELSLAARACVEARPIVVNDMGADERVVFKREHAQFGTRSMAILPLIVAGKAIAIFTLYGDEPGFFDHNEMTLLEELAGDLGFALEHLANLDKLDHLAYYDALTGLPNRHSLERRLAEIIEQAREQGVRFAVGIADVDGFKSINDTLGQDAGDELLRQIASRLAPAVSVRARAVARLGADQFAVVTGDIITEEELLGRVKGARLKAFGPPYLLAGGELRVSAKSGLAIYPTHGGDARTLIKHAEAALKEAKAKGEPELVFHPGMTQQVAAKVALANSLRRALEREEFVLHYQPKVDLKSGCVTGFEALIRWNDPVSGRQVPPMEFIPLLEETGLIAEVGDWALTQAARDQNAWRAAGLAGGRPEALRIAVNVSAVQLRRGDFVGTVKRAIGRERDGAAAGIDLEITESLIMADFEANVDKLRELRALGIGVAIDDFGTGYSSLAYLARLPVQTLKIDRSFVITMLDDPRIMTVVTTIITLAHSFKLAVVAEGVDSEAQKRMLQLLRCDQMQGYLFSKPLPAADVAALLARAERAA